MNSPFTHLPQLGDARGEESITAALVQDLQADRSPQGGLDITLRFHSDSAVLVSHNDKTDLPRMMNLKEGEQCIAELSAIRAGTADPRHFKLTHFAFRHANGGVLPIIETDSQSLVALFLRDIHPVGWNIANGAASTINDLLHPKAVAVREAAEELLFWDAAEQLAIPVTDTLPDDLTAALMLLGEDAGLLSGSTVPFELDTSGPDSLTVHLPNGQTHRTPDTYLSFNLADFGLECTWPAICRPTPGLTLRDGELTPSGMLLNRPVGIFSLPELQDTAGSNPQPIQTFLSGVKSSKKYSAPLCPVTQSILSAWRR